MSWIWKEVEPLKKDLPEELIKEKRYKFDINSALRCYDCVEDLSIEQADSTLCHEVYEMVIKLKRKGWED